MLTKEVKEILEGIQFFLVEGLKDESLSGKVECLRRGLLLQLEGLRTIYPFLHFSSSIDPNANIRNTTTSLSYLNVESQNANSSLMSTSSSSSINYSSTGCSNGSSSTGYSGDGVVTSHNANNSNEKRIENYEDFEDIENCSEITTTTNAPSPRTSSVFPSTDFLLEERDEEAYATSVEPVSFRILVGKCDHHGLLSKRSRSILPGVRNSKTFRCVLAGSLLYFYLKESDDKQKKVIDLTYYSLQECSVDDNKHYSRRREFPFQLISANNKKTHTFFTSKKSSMERWIKSIRQVISPSEISQQVVILPQKAPLHQVDENFSKKLDNEEDDDDDDEEFYEELNPEEMTERSSPKDAPNLWKPPVTSYQPRTLPVQATNVSDYYSVPEEVIALQTQKHIYYNQQRRVPPERPPLPNILRESIQRNRPLPQAPAVPDREYEGPDKGHDDEIYCEIDEESKLDNNFRDSISDIDSSSLSKEIFDTINKRAPSTPEKSFLLRQNTTSINSENYDVPSDSSSSPSWRLTHPPLLKAPFLPPKGKAPSVMSDEESEYKVPALTLCPESLYNVPSNLPVPVSVVEDQHSGRYDDSNFTEVMNEPVSNKTLSDCVNNNRESESDNLTKCSENEETPKEKENNDEKNKVETLGSKLLSKTEERQKTDEDGKVNPSNSVKDLIAKLNQSDDSLETSQKPLCYNSFRKSKVSLNGFENAHLVECKNIIEVSRSVKSIKDNLEKENLKLKLSDANHLCKREESSSISGTLKGIETGSSQTSQIRNDIGKNIECLTQDNRVYIAKFAFVSDVSDGLSFNRGDEIIVKGPQSEERLWKAIIKGREGLVPKEYLRVKD